MKHWLLLIFLGLLLCSPCLSASVMREGEPITATREGDTIFVGFRALCERCGYAVRWEDTYAIAAGERTILADPGENALRVDSTVIWAAILLKEGRTLVPVRALAAALGLEVCYREAGDFVLLYDEEDLLWLARIVEAEAGGECPEGKLAVANVVLNRVASDQFPNTIHDVIFDRQYATQFAPVDNGTVWNAPSEESLEAARQALAGENNIGSALYFFNPALTEAVWIRRHCSFLQSIGDHDFYA